MRIIYEKRTKTYRRMETIRLLLIKNLWINYYDISRAFSENNDND